MLPTCRWRRIISIMFSCNDICLIWLTGRTVFIYGNTNEYIDMVSYIDTLIYRHNSYNKKVTRCWRGGGAEIPTAPHLPVWHTPRRHIIFQKHIIDRSVHFTYRRHIWPLQKLFENNFFKNFNNQFTMTRCRKESKWNKIQLQAHLRKAIRLASKKATQ